MLIKCNSALLLTDVPSFAGMYKGIAKEALVQLKVEEDWSKSYRVAQDVIIAGSKYLDKINEAYISKTVLILRSDESPASFVAKGIERFIFDYQNAQELCMAFYRPDKVIVHTKDAELTDLIKTATTNCYQFGDYDFQFDKNSFKYKGKGIYLCKSQQKYLAEWLLYGNKDNKKRSILFALRKKFGQDFLKDVDRHGELKEEKR